MTRAIKLSPEAQPVFRSSKRRADAMVLVGEARVLRSNGEFVFLAGLPPGGATIMRRELHELWHAGMIEKVAEGGGAVRWSKAGRYMWELWKAGRTS